MISDDAIAWSLARLNTAFVHHYDRREYDEVLAMFAPDAVYEVRGRALHGHADVLTKKVVDILARTVPGVSRVIVIDAPANVPPGGPSRRIPIPEPPVRRQLDIENSHSPRRRTIPRHAGVVWN